MNAEAERHLKALDSLIAIHHADTGQEAVKALAGIIRNLETEAATATAKLETAEAQVAAADTRNAALASMLQSCDLQRVGELLGMPVGTDVLPNLEALVQAVVEERDDWRSRAIDAVAELNLMRQKLPQSQPQPPNSYLAKEVERLQAEAVTKDHRIESLKLELKNQRDATIFNQSNATLRAVAAAEQAPLPCHTLQTHQSDPAAEISRLGAELSEKNATIARLTNEDDYRVNQVNALLEDLRAARAEANNLRAERDRYAKIIDRL